MILFPLIYHGLTIHIPLKNRKTLKIRNYFYKSLMIQIYLLSSSHWVGHSSIYGFSITHLKLLIFFHLLILHWIWKKYWNNKKGSCFKEWFWWISENSRPVVKTPFITAYPLLLKFDEFFQICNLMQIPNWQLIKKNLWKKFINVHSTLMITFLLKCPAYPYHWVCSVFSILHSIKFMKFLMLVCIFHNITLTKTIIFHFCKNGCQFSFMTVLIDKSNIQKYEKRQGCNLTIVEMWTFLNYWFSLDTKGLLHPASEGNHYNYVIFDRFSKYSVTVSVPKCPLRCNFLNLPLIFKIWPSPISAYR